MARRPAGPLDSHADDADMKGAKIPKAPTTGQPPSLLVELHSRRDGTMQPDFLNSIPDL
jgi:hypothetical protein